jgi:asparagine synthase (glutamine-hydrolysing)
VYNLFDKYGTKSILKGVASKYFDHSFIHRNKMGFRIPIGKWIKNEMKGRITATIMDRKQHLIDLDYQLISKILNDHFEGSQDNTHKIWSLFVFHTWAQNN